MVDWLWSGIQVSASFQIFVHHIKRDGEMSGGQTSKGEMSSGECPTLSWWWNCCKRAKCTSLTQLYTLMPVAKETVGVLRNEALHYFENLENVLPPTVTNQGPFTSSRQCISISNKHDNAASYKGTSRRLHGPIPLILLWQWRLFWFRRISVLQLITSATLLKLLVSTSPQY